MISGLLLNQGLVEDPRVWLCSTGRSMVVENVPVAPRTRLLAKLGLLLKGAVTRRSHHSPCLKAWVGIATMIFW